jgi:hypothetical protein
VRYSPYWALAGGRGCVSSAPGGWTRVRVGDAGAVQLRIEFSLGRVFSHGARCT